jgi:hypothetical protein
MIRDNRIIFGYGTVAVGSTNSTIVLTEIKPPQEIGEYLKGKTFERLNSISIYSTFKEFGELRRQLKEIHTKDNKTIDFKGYILDFNMYNEKSVSVIIKHIDNATRLDIMCLAC